MSPNYSETEFIGNGKLYVIQIQLVKTEFMANALIPNVCDHAS